MECLDAHMIQAGHLVFNSQLFSLDSTNYLCTWQWSVRFVVEFLFQLGVPAAQSFKPLHR